MQGSKQEPQDQHVCERSEPALIQVIQTGTVLNDRFLLQELLGEGGMGRVYKALDLRREEVQDPNPYVAIKLLNESIMSMAGAGIALQREAVIAQRLQHHNIASVYDYNRDELFAYIVMELIEGYTLDHLIIADYPEGLPTAQSFKVITQLIETVLFAHHKGVVHADIKPSNVKIMPTGDIKVMDFGLARVMSLMNMTQHTADKEVDSQWRHRSLSDAITPSYATRARLHGRQPIKVDDTYALACVIYLVLTGRHPYQRMNADKALKQGIKPEQPARLSKKQWAVLKCALDPNINKESCALNALSSVFCVTRRKSTQQKRKWLSVAALMFFCGSAIPINAWLNEQLPVWEIRFSDDDKHVELLTNYVSDLLPVKQNALEAIYLPTLVEGWNSRWSTYEPLFDRSKEDQKILVAMLHKDILISSLVTPYFSANKQFVQARTLLEQTRSKYLIDILKDYEAQLASYIATTQPVLASDFMNVYHHATLLEQIAGSSALIQTDPRLNQLLRLAMNEDWVAGRYLPLGEKLQVASVLLTESDDLAMAMGNLSRLMSSEAIDRSDLSKGMLFSEDNLSIVKLKTLMYLPILERLIKEVKLASSNQIDLYPVYRDYLTEAHTQFISLGGDEYRWNRLLIKADLEYGRSLATWGQTEEAFEVVDEILTAQFKY